MEARRLITALGAAVLLAVTPLVATGASARSQNFIVTAQTRPLAEEICRAAEDFRRDLAIEWLGAELPPWQQPCPIEAQVHPQLGAGGATQFSFSRQGVPFGWSMSIQGSKERVIDSVLPHEITHTIFATHFGRPLPRWADEGGCTTVEHVSEKRKQDKFLIEFLMTERGIPFNKMFAMKEYPPDMLPLYAQGYSLARYLIMQGGKRKYVQYVGEGMQTENWPAVTRKYYGHKDLSDLQVTWLEWVRMGSPKLQPVDGIESRSDTMITANAPQPAAGQVAQAMPLNAAPANAGPANNDVAATSLRASPVVTPPATHIPEHALIPRNAHTPVPSRPAAYAKNLDVVSPPRPDLNGATNSTAAAASNVARPYSEGWYARRRDETRNPSQVSNHAVPPPDPVPATTEREVQATPSAHEPAGATPPLNRRVMLEWSRPTDQPWTPGSIPTPERANEILARRDLPAEIGSGSGRY
jgi:hypothetical protein